MSSSPSVRVLLASTSRYRASLLGRIVPVFEQRAPQVDETPRSGEAPAALSRRLADAKAAAAPFDGVVIGCDQVAALDGKPLGKPGSRANAERQLSACRGRTVDFLTSVAVVGGDLPAARHTDTTRVVFRHFDDALLGRYLDRDEPFDCAGGFKAEAAGPVLFERIDSSDPTALIGLPLIWLAAELERRGIELLRGG